MDQLSRAFGMPSPAFFSPTTSLFDLPAADLPAVMPAMAKSLVRWGQRPPLSCRRDEKLALHLSMLAALACVCMAPG